MERKIKGSAFIEGDFEQGHDLLVFALSNPSLVPALNSIKEQLVYAASGAPVVVAVMSGLLLLQCARGVLRVSMSW